MEDKERDITVSPPEENVSEFMNVDFFKAIFKSAQDSVFIKDCCLRYIHVNPTMEELLGISASRLVGSTDEAIFGKEASENDRETDIRALDGNIVEEEYVKLIKGSPFTFHLIKAPLRDSSGMVIGLFGIFHNINEKMTQQNYTELEEKYHLVLENANQVIVVIQDRIIRFASGRTLELLGYSKDELLSKDFADFIYPEDRDMILERHLKRMAGEDVLSQYDFRIVNRYGNIRWVYINAVRINWGEKPATLKFLTDITERRKTEEEVIKADRLESLGTLAGGIAHDFNNILTAILGNISLAKMYATPGDKIYERLTEAEKASFRARDLTQQLLTFAKGGDPILSVMPIAKLLRESVSFALSGSNVKCEYSIPDNALLVEIDESQIRHVIHDIVLNADQAMPDGGILRVSVENVIVGTEFGNILKPGRYLKISIEDQGIGIPEENLPKIFDPYFTTKQKRTGLGLTIAYSIVRKHGGHIVVDSKLGVGTIFYIYLPASKIQNIELEHPENEEIESDRGKILVMDDDESIREVTFENLTELGYEVSMAVDGEEAIRLYKAAQDSGSPFEAVILDLTIHGGMGGKDAIKGLIKIDPKVNAIVSSGYSNDPVMARYEEFGFKGFIAKPYKIKDLNELLRKILSKRK